MRISDWSSDVCSSDLRRSTPLCRARRGDGDRLDGTLAFGRAQDTLTAKPGLSVIGEVPVLDMIGWAGFASSSPTAAGDAGTASPVRSVDMSVGQIDVLDRAVSDTRVQLGLLDHGVQLHFDGAQIKGTLDVPSPLPALRGRFDRLYWPSSRPAGEGRSEEHTSELKSLMRISYAVFCLINKDGIC